MKMIRKLIHGYALPVLLMACLGAFVAYFMPYGYYRTWGMAVDNWQLGATSLTITWMALYAVTVITWLGMEKLRRSICEERKDPALQKIVEAGDEETEKYLRRQEFRRIKTFARNTRLLLAAAFLAILGNVNDIAPTIINTRSYNGEFLGYHVTLIVCVWLLAAIGYRVMQKAGKNSMRVAIIGGLIAAAVGGVIGGIAFDMRAKGIFQALVFVGCMVLPLLAVRRKCMHKLEMLYEENAEEEAYEELPVSRQRTLAVLLFIPLAVVAIEIGLLALAKFFLHYTSLDLFENVIKFEQAFNGRNYRRDWWMSFFMVRYYLPVGWKYVHTMTVSSVYLDICLAAAVAVEIAAYGPKLVCRMLPKVRNLLEAGWQKTRKAGKTVRQAVETKVSEAEAQRRSAKQAKQAAQERETQQMQQMQPQEGAEDQPAKAAYTTIQISVPAGVVKWMKNRRVWIALALAVVLIVGAIMLATRDGNDSDGKMKTHSEQSEETGSDTKQKSQSSSSGSSSDSYRDDDDRTCPDCIGGDCIFCTNGEVTCTGSCIGGRCIGCDDGYTLVDYDSKGNPVMRKCSYCNYGKCKTCGGDGYMKCDECRGTGKCRTCGGDGKR